VIGAVRGDRKQRLVEDLGADAVLDYGRDDFAEQLRAATGGAGAEVVFDGLGGTMADVSLEALANGRGRLVVYGYASGEPLQVSSAQLVPRGISVIGFGGQAALPGYQTELVAEAIGHVQAGRIRPVVGQRYPLEHAADAHAAVEARQTVGKTVLIPSAGR
jgi:NADPH2:quinone reductase